MFLSFGASLDGWRGFFVIVDVFIIVIDQWETLFLSVAPMNEKFDQNKNNENTYSPIENGSKIMDISENEHVPVIFLTPPPPNALYTFGVFYLIFDLLTQQVCKINIITKSDIGDTMLVRLNAPARVKRLIFSVTCRPPVTLKNHFVKTQKLVWSKE